MKYTKKQIQESIKHWEAVLEKLNAADLKANSKKVSSNPLELPAVKKFIGAAEAEMVKQSNLGFYKCAVNFNKSSDVFDATAEIIKYFEDCGFTVMPSPEDSNETWICWNDTEDQLKESEHKHITRDEAYARTQAARARMAENCEDTK